MNRILQSKYKTPLFLIIFFITLNVFISSRNFTIDQPGLGKAEVREGEINGIPVRDNSFNPLVAIQKLPDPKTNDGLIVWVGNSQQHALNQPKPDDKLASVILHNLLNGSQWPGEYPVFGMSYPNLDFGEMFSLVYVLSQLKEKKPKIIIMGVRFQDTKQLGFRNEFLALNDLADTQFHLNGFLNSKHNEPGYNLAVEDLRSALKEETVLKKEEKSFEHHLSTMTEKVFPIYENREVIRGWVLNELYWLRNHTLGIKTSTKRRVKQTRYDTAMEYFLMALEAAKESGIKLFVYNIPLRPSKESPYDSNEYNVFKIGIASLCEENNAIFKDYDELVPEDEWGLWDTAGEPDYMHFTGLGHRRLASAVYRDIQGLLR